MRFYSILKNKDSPSNLLMSMFAIIMAINYPLYLFIWFLNDYEGDLGVGLRFVATALCVAIIFRKYWPLKIKKWLPIYWFGMVTFCLPFFFVYMTLKNNGEVLWIMNTLSALFFSLIIFDFFSAITVLILGCLLALVSFIALGNHFIFIPGTVTIGSISATFFAAIVIGSVFTRIRNIIETEKHKELILNETIQKSKLINQEKFSVLARKVAHDINSPLCTLKLMVDLCDELPEEKRNVLRRATESILDIANNLISNNQISPNDHNIQIELHQEILVSELLRQILSEKRIQYLEKSIRFEENVNNNAQFAFIRTQKSEFRRAISNLIDNAVDALKEKNDAKITVGMISHNHAVMVIVEDNGDGMLEENVQKINQRRYFTNGKKNGHGIGLQQVWDMLQENCGRLVVQSKLGQGTMVKLTFPRSAAATWIIQEMRLTPDQIILILDDEQSVHDAWNMNFAPLLETYPQLRLHHFTQGKKLLNFINELAPFQKDNLVLLSDYELLNQPKNGIEIIQSSKVKHSILVTSHYDHPTLRDIAKNLKIKILPKQMTSFLSIHVMTQ